MADASRGRPWSRCHGPGRRRPRSTRVASPAARSISCDATTAVAPEATACLHEIVDEVAPIPVESGMRLVEQPQQRSTTHENRHRGSAPLAGRETGHRDRAKPAADAESLHRGLGITVVRAIGGCPEPHVLFDAEIVVEGRAMAEQTDPSPHRSTTGRRREIGPEHRADPVVQPRQPGTQPEQGALSCPVGSLEKHDLPATRP